MDNHILPDNLVRKSRVLWHLCSHRQKWFQWTKQPARSKVLKTWISTLPQPRPAEDPFQIFP